MNNSLPIQIDVDQQKLDKESIQNNEQIQNKEKSYLNEVDQKQNNDSINEQKNDHNEEKEQIQQIKNSPSSASNELQQDDEKKDICKFEKYMVQCGGTNFQIYKHYELSRLVGSGAYGVVASGKNQLNNNSVAIKKLLDIILPDDPNNFKDIYLVFELMQTDLQRVIQSSLPLTDKQINWFMYQIMLGLYHLHSANVIHRDLKPNNLLVNKNCDLKIGDLNLARKVDQNNFITDYVVTRWYRAPEVILSQSEYTQAIDLWSVGCILAELLGRTILFQGQNPVEQIEKIVAVLGTPKEGDLPYKIEQRTQNYLNQLPRRNGVEWKDVFIYANPLAVDLLSKLLVYNPDRRITAEEALQHPYFNEIYTKIKPVKCEEFFDWSFDLIEPTKQNLMKMIYDEAYLFQK